MLIINVKENESIDKALKRFKKKFEKNRRIERIASRTSFLKTLGRRRSESFGSLPPKAITLREFYNS